MRETGWRDIAEHEVEAMATPEDDVEYWSAVQALTERHRAEHPLY